MGRDSQSLCLLSKKTGENLPPFKCFAKNKYWTVYKSSAYGPKFGKIETAYRYSNKRVEARAILYEPYSVPAEVKNNYNVLVGTAKTFSPDNYEVFFLAWKSSLEKNKQIIKEKTSNDIHFAGLQTVEYAKNRNIAWGNVGLSSFFFYYFLLLT